jgi:Domain of unknown function (DUF4407)
MVHRDVGAAPLVDGPDEPVWSEAPTRSLEPEPDTDSREGDSAAPTIPIEPETREQGAQEQGAQEQGAQEQGAQEQDAQEQDAHGPAPQQPAAHGREPQPEPQREPVEPGLAAPELADLIRDRMRHTRSGPLRRVTLYASGVDTRVLWYAPVEESEFIVQGSLVILTAIVAGVSALAAASFLTAGRFVLSPVTVLVGLIWGVLMFFFDRALVSGTFNPHHFTRAELDSLHDPGSPTPWEHLVAVENGSRPRGRGRVSEFIRVFLVASLRIALALATSYIAAEMALFLVFQPEVNARTAYLQQQQQAQRIASIQADFSTEASKRAAQREQLSGVNDPEVRRLTAQINDLTPQLDAGRKDLGILQAAAAAELDGDKYQATLTNGSLVKTTGFAGNGAAAQSLAKRRDAQQALVDDLNSRLARARTDLDNRRAEVQKTNSPALSTLDALDNKATADQQAALAGAVSDPNVVEGLLIRQAALYDLEHDAKPETLAADPPPPCHGLLGWLCQLRNFFLPPTPMGPTVIAYRVIFFVIEILPITYKVISSLRRRRPYDIAKAALEEVSAIDAFRVVDRYLHDASREAAERAARRRQ